MGLELIVHDLDKERHHSLNRCESVDDFADSGSPIIAQPNSGQAEIPTRRTAHSFLSTSSHTVVGSSHHRENIRVVQESIKAAVEIFDDLQQYDQFEVRDVL